MTIFYNKFLRPLLFKLDPEHAHDVACSLLGTAERFKFAKFLARSFFRTESNPTEIMGLKFPNQIGQAAGLDKNGRFPGISSCLGFGHIEVGTVTPKGQPGNPRPRLFRYPNFNALVNRMGFNNVGSKALADQIAKVYPKGKRFSPLGINIGKSKDTTLDQALNDYLTAFSDVAYQADYIAINISSPNTADLRDLHQEKHLKPLLAKVRDHNLAWATNNDCSPVPCLLKISPDEDYKSLEKIVSLALDYSFDGIIATNTSVYRNKANHGVLFEKGGLSGMPIERHSTEIIRFVAKLTNHKLPIIGVGGIFDRESALRKLDAGASLLQIYTAFVYDGPKFPSKLANSLAYRKRQWS